MVQKSIFYKQPLLYIWGLKWIHKANFSRRYRYMASFAQEGDLVLEPACGPATLANFLHKGVSYRGFDTNREFLNHALKKHPDVYPGNVLEPQSYCQADVVVACDILHHLKPIDRTRFINYCFSSAQKAFILCEPGKGDMSSTGVFYSLKKWLAEWSEKDGTNDFKIEFFLTRSQLLSQIEQGFGVIPPSIERDTEDFGEDIVTVFFKNS